jgi:hypothetical protein
MVERPIPVETRLKPDPPGLCGGCALASLDPETGWGVLTAAVGVGASILLDVWNLSRTYSVCFPRQDRFVSIAAEKP